MRDSSERWATVSDGERSVSDCHPSDAREVLAALREAPLAPPLSIAPVESGAEALIERDATTARSDAQHYWLLVGNSDR